jgi:hypothetical protein
MKIRAERIICYPNEGISLYKVNDLNSRSYLIIDKEHLIKMINSTTYKNQQNDINLIINHYGKFNDGQLKNLVTNIIYIINHNGDYDFYRGVKEILFEEEDM